MGLAFLRVVKPSAGQGEEGVALYISQVSLQQDHHRLSPCGNPWKPVLWSEQTCEKSLLTVTFKLQAWTVSVCVSLWLFCVSLYVQILALKSSAYICYIQTLLLGAKVHICNLNVCVYSV